MCIRDRCRTLHLVRPEAVLQIDQTVSTRLTDRQIERGDDNSCGTTLGQIRAGAVQELVDGHAAETCLAFGASYGASTGRPATLAPLERATPHLDSRGNPLVRSRFGGAAAVAVALGGILIFIVFLPHRVGKRLDLAGVHGTKELIGGLAHDIDRAILRVHKRFDPHEIVANHRLPL